MKEQLEISLNIFIEQKKNLLDLLKGETNPSTKLNIIEKIQSMDKIIKQYINEIKDSKIKI